MVSEGAVRACRETIAAHSKSFALASKLLPRECRDEAAVLYTWCRRTDDAIDTVAPEAQGAALEGLRRTLDAVYAGEPQGDLTLAAFQEVVQRRAIPRHYPDELLRGMEMDALGFRYATEDDLTLYCYRVAGVVGLMMCHVMGVRDARALANAAKLGIAMQLTNVARDVAEDWARGRLYLPDDLLAKHGAPGLAGRLGGPFPPEARRAVAAATAALLRRAERYYRAGDEGIASLSFRSAVAVRTARRVYSFIGAVSEARGCDPLAGRAVVSTPRKLWLAAGATASELLRAPARVARPFTPATLDRIVKHDHDLYEH